MPRTRTQHPILKHLMQAGRQVSPLLVMTHDYPDPDGIASAWTLAFLAERLAHIRTRIVYGGLIGRMENQLMVKRLRIPIKLARREYVERCEHVVLVDTQPPFQNNQFRARRRATMVIDHHPRHQWTKADFLLIDPSAGATATLVAEALLASGLEIPRRLATAIAYGIGSETQNLIRGAGPRDVDIYRAMFPRINMQDLSKIQNPPRPASFFHTVGKAIDRAFVVGRIIGVHLGPVPHQDIVAHMADFLLTHEKMRWSMVTGRYDGRLCVSLRTRQSTARAGRLLWRLLGGSTLAGGHAMIAGGFIPIGKEADDVVWQQAEETLTNDFLKSQGHKEPFAFEYPLGRQ